MWGSLTRQAIVTVTLPAIAAAVSLSAMLAPPASTPMAGIQAAPRVRRDIRDIEQSPEALKNLRHALFMLKKQAPTCGNATATSEYDCWAAFHNDFNFAGCQHLSDLFWPWHRYHLAEFEKALRASDPAHPDRVATVTLPYWNWTVKPSGVNFPASVEQQTLRPGEFYPEDCPDAANCPNPLYVPGRRGSEACPLVKQACVTDALDLPTWEAFGGSDDFASPFELQAHNFMHSSYIDGPMGDPRTAARDPVYWMFHAYIDRVWDRWQQAHQTNPCDPANVGDASRPLSLGAWPAGTIAFKDALCSKDMGYAYEEAPLLAADLPNCPAEQATCGTADGTAVVLTSAATPSAIERAELRLDGLTVPHGFSYDVRVFVHPARVRPQPRNKAFADRYAATAFSAWRLDGHGRPGGPVHAMRVRLDVTRRLQAIVGSGGKDPLSATLVFSRAGSNAAREPLVFRTDVTLAAASLIVRQAGQQREWPLVLPR